MRGSGVNEDGVMGFSGVVRDYEMGMEGVASPQQIVPSLPAMTPAVVVGR